MILSFMALAWWHQRRLRTFAEEARREADQLAEEARLASEAKTRFLANVSHEIRTPLTTMIGHGDLLGMRGDLPARSQESVNAIQRGGQHLLAVISDVIDLAQLEVGHKRSKPETISLPSLLMDFGRFLEIRGGKKGVKTQLEISPDLPKAVYLDGTLLHQILLNLGRQTILQAKGNVHVRARHLPGTAARPLGFLRVDLRDDGRSIPPEEQARLFEPFSALRGRSKEQSPLVLSLAHGLVGVMEGEIGVEGLEVLESLTNEKEGTRFWFEIPLMPVPATPSVVSDKEHPETASARMPRVLVVEDEKPILQLFIKVLEDLPIELRTAADGLSTKECLQGWTPDLVLMDFRLPDASGGELAEVIRGMPGGVDVWITCLSADVLGIQESMTSSPFDDYLDKPIRIGALLTYVERTLAAKSIRTG